jgi:hypothetical protein
MNESLAIRVDLKEKGLMAESRANEAEVLLESGEYAAAETSARDACAEFKREKEVDQEAWTWAVIGTTLLSTRKA